MLKVSCLGGGLCQGHIGNTDPTPFLQEIVTVDGVSYYHVIVLDDPNGFRQEVYIEQGVASWQGGQGTMSGGGSSNRNDAFQAGSGSGTGNARKTVLLQTLSGGGISQSFRKDQLDRKPVITQDVADAEITAAWRLDMSNST